MVTAPTTTPGFDLIKASVTCPYIRRNGLTHVGRRGILARPVLRCEAWLKL
jgi:hypothetical protein